MDGSEEADLREQHKRRMSFMPWLYFNAPPAVLQWATPWQHKIHADLRRLECIDLDEACFVAPTAQLFAEPHRRISIGPSASIAAEAFLHGPILIAANVSINARVTMDGGKAGIQIGAGTRIATGATLFAFNHGIAPEQPIRDQPHSSEGIVIGQDVWIGAQAGITDGVTVGDHAVVGMGAVVTRNVPPWAVVAGVPARVIGDRRALPLRSP